LPLRLSILALPLFVLIIVAILFYSPYVVVVNGFLKNGAVIKVGIP